MFLDLGNSLVTLDGLPEDDGFDPRFWGLAPAREEPFKLHLSDRIDCYCLLDREDYEWARQWKWCHTYGSGDIDPETGVISRPDGIYARRCVGGKTLFLHREICLRAYGAPAPEFNIGDHLNGHTLDNRRVNLRWATRSMNRQNVKGSTVRERFVLEQQRAQMYAQAC